MSVAEWERNAFKTDTIKMGALGADDYTSMKSVFPRTWGIPYDAYLSVISIVFSLLKVLMAD